MNVWTPEFDAAYRAAANSFEEQTDMLQKEWPEQIAYAVEHMVDDARRFPWKTWTARRGRVIYVELAPSYRTLFHALKPEWLQAERARRVAGGELLYVKNRWAEWELREMKPWSETRSWIWDETRGWI